ncbi:MAG: phenazine biosynthesis protein, PhzF family [Osedax symbiont Rs1]|nr:MAG: phenazine biosynthesis protein, PhzF family [Osedax symbiont Rs1]
MHVEVVLVNSFTHKGEGGNPGGVVFDAEHLSDRQRLKVAQAVGFSETAFVTKDAEADFEVAFFTITEEVDYCGHATLAVFSTLFTLNMLNSGTYLQRTKAGLLAVTIDASGSVIMQQKLPQKLQHFSHQEIAAVIGIDSSVLASTKLPVEAISTGLSDVIIAVPTGYLDVIIPRDKIIANFCRKHQVVGLHVFELYGKESAISASCRNFAPLFGISEESATGSASGALACYLAEHSALPHNYIFEQGRAINKTSIITASVTCHDDLVTSVKVGGTACILKTITVSI